MCKEWKRKYVQGESCTGVVVRKNLLNLEHNINWQHSGYDVELLPRKPRFDSPEKLNIFSFIVTKLTCKNDGGGESQGCVQVVSAASFRMRGIEDVGTVELVFVGGLLLLPVWRSLGDGFTGKGQFDVWVVRAGT